MIGENTPKVSYGKNREDNVGWITAIKRDSNYSLDWSRIHVVGTLSYELLIKMYQVSAAHVYLSYPFVLSWSMLEAMSCECLVIGSSTQPVEEVIIDGVNGLLVPFNEPNILAKRLHDAISNQVKFINIRTQARKHILKKYELHSCLEKHIDLIRKTQYSKS